MKRILFQLIFALIIFSGCSNGNTKPVNKSTDKELTGSAPGGDFSKLIGSYVGPFGDNKITVLIIKATSDSVEGRSIDAGNDRPFTGTVKLNGGKYNMSAQEPGTDKYDGTFEITMDPSKPDEITGTWKPFKPSDTLTSKTFTLLRKEFQYLGNVGEYPQASQRILKEADVSNLLADELLLMRNEIFARHGYSFKTKEMRTIFEIKDWYIPNSADVKNDLTAIEKQNIALIKRYEKYAKDYGDDYGR